MPMNRKAAEQRTGRSQPLRPASEPSTAAFLNLLVPRRPPEALPELDFA